MDITNLKLTDSDDFTSYTDSYDPKIYYNYAKFTDYETGEIKYGVRATKYKKLKGGECEVGSWSEISKSEFEAIKNMER